MNYRTFLLSFAFVAVFSLLSLDCGAASLAFNYVNVAGISLGMNVSQAKAVYPKLRIYENKTEFRGIQVRFLMGELRGVGGNSGETLFLYFDSSAYQEARVLKVIYWVGFDGEGQTMLETAIEINNAKAAFLKKYGDPDLYKDVAPDTYITYNIHKPGGIQGEVVLAAKITRSISTDSMTGLLQVELTDKGGLLRQQVRWIQEDAELKVKRKNKKLHF